MAEVECKHYELERRRLDRKGSYICPDCLRVFTRSDTLEILLKQLQELRGQITGRCFPESPSGHG